MNAELIVLHHNKQTVCAVDKDIDLVKVRKEENGWFYERCGLLILRDEWKDRDMLNVYIYKDKYYRVKGEYLDESYKLMIDGSDDISGYFQSVSKKG